MSLVIGGWFWYDYGNGKPLLFTEQEENKLCVRDVAPPL